MRTTMYWLIRSFIPNRVLLASGAVLCGATLALAVAPTSVFELDGNVADDPTNSIADWNTLNGDCTVPGGGSGSAGGSNTRTCIGSENPPKIFTQGGSKDPLDISQWHWKPADTVPDKDTITHAYAASYTASPSGDKVVVVGGDRFAVNGDANIGAWFFQQNITLNSNGTFSGVHVDHDVFLVSAFVGGGGTAVLTAYEWDSLCGNGVKNPAPGNVRTITSGCSAASTLSRSPTAAPFPMRPGPTWRNSVEAPTRCPSEPCSREAPISLPCSQQAAPGPFPVSAASCWRPALRSPPAPCSRIWCSAPSRSAISASPRAASAPVSMLTGDR